MKGENERHLCAAHFSLKKSALTPDHCRSNIGPSSEANLKTGGKTPDRDVRNANVMRTYETGKFPDARVILPDCRF